MTDVLRIVVVGCGSIGSRHASILDALPDVVVTVVAGRPGRGPELRAKGLNAADSFVEALASGPDGVIVATDSGRHARDAVHALEHGANVLVEKPVATSVDGARTIVEAAASAGRSAHVAACLRFDPGMQWLVSRLDHIGSVRLADAECTSWLPDWRPGRDHRDGYAARVGEGGVMLDLIHEIDLAEWLVGPLELRGAVLANHGELGLPPEVEETAVLLGEGRGSIGVTIRLSFATRTERRVLRLTGEHGVLEWDYVGGVATSSSVDGDVLDQFRWTGRDEMYRSQLTTWLAHLRRQPSGGLVDAAEGLRAVAICEAARRLAGAQAVR